MRKKIHRFIPSVAVLEDRQMLTAIPLSYPNDPLLLSQSDFVMKSDNLVNIVSDNETKASADSVVGAGYTLQVFPEAPVASVTFSMPGSLSGDTLTGSATGYGTNAGSFRSRTSVLETVTAGQPNQLPLVHEYFNSTVGERKITADVKYAASTNLPDTIYTVMVEVYAPQGTISANLPPKTGPGSYGIGYADKNGNALPAGYQPGQQFGLMATGASPFLFGGSVRNTTPTSMGFFMSQLATPTKVGSKGYLLNDPVFQGFTPWNDNYSAGLGLDEWKGSSDPAHPLATFGWITNLNAWDNTVENAKTLPSVFDSPGNYNPMSSGLIPWDFTYVAGFKTMVCCQASGDAIPIMLASMNWSISAHYTNTAAMNNATTANAFGDPSLWKGNAVITPSAIINNNPQLVPGYNYNVPEFLETDLPQYPAQGAAHPRLALYDGGNLSAPVHRHGRLDDLAEPVQYRAGAASFPSVRARQTPYTLI